MSVINQMLKDLDQRHAKDAAAAPIPKHWPPGQSPDESKRLLHRIPWITLTLVACTLGFLWYEQGNPPADQFYVMESQPAPIASQATVEVAAEPAIDSPKDLALLDVVKTNAKPEVPVVCDHRLTHSLDFALNWSMAEFSPHHDIAPAVASSTELFVPSHGVLFDLRNRQAAAIANTESVTAIEDAEPPVIRETRLSRTSVTDYDSSLDQLSPEAVLAQHGESVSRETDTVVSITPAEGAAEQSYKKARHYLDNWNTTAAQQELERTLVFDPEHFAARELLSALHMQLGNDGAAEAVVDAGISLSPRHSPFVQIKARILAARNEHEVAVTLLKSTRPLPTHRFDHQTTLAALQQQLGRHEEAVGIYLNLIEANPEKSMLWSGLAISLDAQGEYEAAIKSYRQALDDHLLAPALRRYAKQRLHALGAVIQQGQS